MQGTGVLLLLMLCSALDIFPPYYVVCTYYGGLLWNTYCELQRNKQRVGSRQYIIGSEFRSILVHGSMAQWPLVHNILCHQISFAKSQSSEEK